MEKHIIQAGESIMLGEVKTSEFGQICPKCNEEMWPMNDATTMAQGDPMCACCKNSCLDIFYGSRFVQNETLQIINDRIEGRDITQYQTMYTPVLPGSMSGIIHCNESKSCGYIFNVSSGGFFHFTRFIVAPDGKHEFPPDIPKLSDGQTLQLLASAEFDDRFLGWYDEVYAPETSLNCQTGVLELHYHMGRVPEVVVCYEYNKFPKEAIGDTNVKSD